MRLRFFLLLISFSALSASLFANPVIDSVGIENQNGKKIILHKVEAKDNYYAIARRYNVKPQAVIQFNTNAVLHVGDIVKVPTDRSFVETVPLPAQTAPVQATTAQVNKPITHQSAPISSPNLPQTTNSANTSDAGAVIQYKVAQHEYLFGIAKRFNTTVEDIKKLNNLQNNNLSPGQVINVRQGAGIVTAVPQSTPAPTTQTQQTAQPTSVATQPTVAASATRDTGMIQYTVTKREYLYSVAKRFNTSVEDIKRLNNLKSNTLSAGMVLTIHQGSGSQLTPLPSQPLVPKPDTIPPLKRDSNGTPIIADSLNAEHHATSRYGLYEKNERGVATTLEDPTLDQTKKLILHRTAPIGTVIKITNPMTNRTTFAKVVGRFTDNESTKDVILVMTKSVAESLGALDKRFHVNISYGVPNE